MQKKYWLFFGLLIFALDTVSCISIWSRCSSEPEECASWQVELLSKQISLGADGIISFKLNRKTYFDESFKVILIQSSKKLTLEIYSKSSNDDKLILAAPFSATDLTDFQAGLATVEVIQYLDGTETARSAKMDLTLR